MKGSLIHGHRKRDSCLVQFCESSNFLVMQRRDHMDECANEMGKRGAARIQNSGLPVDDSGPELRVGPTTPVTADLTSAACPPISPFASNRSDSSQHKSRRESESGALSGASEASDEMLRSEATQRGSSLVEIQNNRNIGVPQDFQALGRNRNCGKWTIVGINGLRRRFHRLNCKTWGCSYCGQRKAKRYRFLIGQLAEKEQLTRFLTLTLDPSKIEGDSVRYLRSVFNKFRLYCEESLGRRSPTSRYWSFTRVELRICMSCSAATSNSNGSKQAGARLVADIS
jgi:hypothetical protein